jgi:hypothetical protein
MPKRRVESCLIIGTPRGALRDIKGRWDWPLYGWTVDYAINATYSELRLSFNHGVHVEQEISLLHTTPNYGGVRWWFLCPKCSRRVSNLYRPSGAYCFLCRHCYDLTYESAQMSRGMTEKFFQRVARTLQSNTREARRWVRLNYAKQSYVSEVKRPAMNKTRERRTGIALLVTKTARSKGLTL